MLTGATGNQDTLLYHVQPGDSLNKIIRSYYGPINIQQHQSIIRQIQADNPQITNPNLIYPGQALLIDIPRQFCPAPGINQPQALINADKNTFKPLVQQWHRATPQEKSWLSVMTPIMLGSGAAGLTMIDTTFKTNAPLVAEMAENYTNYKQRTITNGQYRHRRQKLLHKLKTKLGPTQRILSGNKPANEVLRISRAKGVKPTVNIIQQVNKMTRLSKFASRGGVVLSVAGLGVACYNIANTASQHEKNEILVESVSSFGGGIIYGAVASVLLVGTPIGWVAALVIGIGGALTGFGTGKIAKHYYTISGAEIDFASKTGVNHLCK